MINFYQDLWPRRLHTLAPLTKLSAVKKKRDFYWGAEEQNAFEEAKRMLANDALLAYLDFSKLFNVYSDASDYQLGATVVQNGRPLGFYTRKLSASQKNYTVGEKELLGIVEGLKAFEGMLYGQKITVHTDHLNLLYKNNPSQQLQLLLEEYGLTIVHIAGERNDAADALSRLPMSENHMDAVEWGTTNKPLQYADRIPREIDQLLDNEVLLPLALEERLKNKKFPLAPDMIQWYQQEDEKLQKKLQSKTTDSYTLKEIEGFNLVHYRNKIFVPKKLRK